MLASVAAMQGRIAMWHALGDAVAPLDLKIVSSQRLHRARDRHGRRQPGPGRLPARCRRDGHAAAAAATPRAKMQGIRDGFVKLFCLPVTGIVVGGVVVAPRASELIYPLAVAVAAAADRRPGRRVVHGLSVDVRLDRRGGPAPARTVLTARRPS